VGKVLDKEQGPIIVFAFSKAECENNSLGLKSMDFTNIDEKKAIE
jgi:superfamily II RNA helicase